MGRSRCATCAVVVQVSCKSRARAHGAPRRPLLGVFSVAGAVKPSRWGSIHPTWWRPRWPARRRGDGGGGGVLRTMDGSAADGAVGVLRTVWLESCGRCGWSPADGVVGVLRTVWLESCGRCGWSPADGGSWRSNRRRDGRSSRRRTAGGGEPVGEDRRAGVVAGADDDARAPRVRRAFEGGGADRVLRPVRGRGEARDAGPDGAALLLVDRVRSRGGRPERTRERASSREETTTRELHAPEERSREA